MYNIVISTEVLNILDIKYVYKTNQEVTMAVHDYIKSGDFATEKHVPVIETVDTVKAGETFHVTLSVGKDIAHPNTVEHHIDWIKLYFVAEGTQLPFEVGAIEFNVHGDGATANEGPVAAVSEGTLAVALKKSGKLIAVSYCNIHGLWESEKDIVVA